MFRRRSFLLEVHAISKKIRTDFSAFHIKQSYRNTFAFESASQKTFNLYFNNFDVVYGSAISFLPRVNPPTPTILEISIPLTFLLNLEVLISMKAAATAFMYDLGLLNVTLPDPIGYLYLSVSIPV
jgi:hypothetical protein